VKKAKALVPGLDVSIIPNGVDTELFKPLLRNTALAESLDLINEGQVEESGRVIGFAGELRQKKGLRLLLSAYAQINKKNPATLLIVGDVRAGEDKQILEDFKLSHPEASIMVTGFVSPADLPSYYSLMDLFVHPSLRDGLPNALLEAMACGVTVIGTPVGGIKDVVVDCENGRLVSTNNVNELASAIEELLTNKDLRKKLGCAGRQTIIHKFTLESELDGNLTVYRRLGLKA
jgi:glycosyltransferase involved in cell wall biosynthesis